VLLRFYLERSVRYGCLDKDAAAEGEVFLDSLEAGYSLRFNRSGLVFDFEKPGTEAPTSEVGIEFHRIGFDLIRVLIEGVDPGSSSDVDGGPNGGGPPVPQDPAAPTPPLIGLPQLQSAAFLAPDRPRSTSVGVLEDVGSAAASEPSDNTQREALNGEPFSEMPPEPTETAKVQPVRREELAVAQEPAILHRGPTEREVPWDVLLGVSEDSPQYGLLGEVSARRVALDLNQTHTISLFGVRGGGKSYTLGTIIEMACMAIPHVSVLPRPLGTILFHYSSTLDYKPEFTSMVQPNTNEAQVDMLRQRYGANPRGLSDIVILVPASKVAERRQEYPGIDVIPIAFSARELKATHWKFLMGAVGSQSLYLRQVNLIMKKLREDLTLDSVLQAIEDSSLSDHLKDLARIRLKFAGEYIDDTRSLTGVIRPGRLVIVDLRDEFIEKDEALGLFVVLLQIFAEATYQGRSFNKLVVFDEAHKYIESQDLVTGLVEVVREMRHKGTSILVASQDPPSVPTALIELSSQVILHKFNSPAWLRHIQKANSALNNLTPEKLSSLGAGEAYLWSSKSTDTSFSNGAVRIRCRPRVTQHGGATKTAI
jgi:DNA phosphorothioation-dependent restriction protein DptH